MSALNTIFILVAAFLAVFGEAAFPGVRHWLGAQVDLLPALMVYASLCAGLATVALLAVLGGLWFDSLSANPLGVSILPLFIVGLRDLSATRIDFARPAACAMRRSASARAPRCRCSRCGCCSAPGCRHCWAGVPCGNGS